MRSFKRRLSSIRGPAACLAVLNLLGVLLSGCLLGPDFETPEAPVSKSWREAEHPPFLGAPANQLEWWKAFNDPILNSLIEKALDQNLGLHAASLRIVQARIRKSVAVELFFPLLTGQGSIVHTNSSTTVKPTVDVSLPSVTVNVPPTTPDLPPLLEVSGKPSVSVSDDMDVYDAGFDASWELDLWGGVRRRVQATKAEIDASYAEYDAMLVSLTGEVAATYVQIRMLQQRILSLQSLLTEMEGFLKIAQDRHQIEIVPQTDALMAATLVSSTREILPDLRSAQRQLENSLCVLLGMAPQDLTTMMGSEGAIPTFDPRISLGIPADLLRRRPDIRAVENRARAQCARIGMRKADLLPSFSLLGSIGLQSSDSDLFFESESVQGAYGGLVKVTNILFYPFTIERVRMEDAQFEEAMLVYKQVVLHAQQEVEDAIFEFLMAQEKRAILADGLDPALRAGELTVAAYGRGEVPIADPLYALRVSGVQRDQAILADGRAAIDLISMYKALGGGWENREDDQLVPEEIRERMRQRTDWWTFSGKSDLNTKRTE